MDCVYVDRERGVNGVVNPEVHTDSQFLIRDIAPG